MDGPETGWTALADPGVPRVVAGLASRLVPLPGKDAGSRERSAGDVITSAVARSAPTWRSVPASGAPGNAAGSPGGKRAAVLIALHGSDADLRIVFVEKAAGLRAHGGQVAFPGGLIEASDASPAVAALREAWEEAGITPASVVPLGILPTTRTRIPRRGVDVVPIVGWWAAPGPLASRDADEIAAVHVLRVDDLLDPANRVTWAHPRGTRGPAFAVGDLFVWGLTAGLLDALFELAGWSVPWDATREVAIPSRFLRGSLP